MFKAVENDWTLKVLESLIKRVTVTDKTKGPTP